MRLSRHIRLLLAAQTVCAVSLFAQGTYKVEPAGALPPEAGALQATLQPSGARLVNDQGTIVAEVWLRKSVAAQQAGAQSADVLYPQLGTGTMLGVVRFPNGGADFRGQAIKPGVYTLRYAQVPQDGNHMGVSTYRDFLLLSPIAQDANADASLGFDALVKLSRQASGSGHPAVLSLAPATGSKTPSTSQDDQGHRVMQVEVPAGAQGFPMGIILVGKSEGG